MASEFEVLSTLYVIEYRGNECVLIELIVMCGVGMGKDMTCVGL